MTQLHKARLAALVLGVLTILLALTDGIGGFVPPIGAGSGPQGGAEDYIGEDPSEEVPGYFRRRNPFRIVRQHPEEEQPAAKPTRPPSPTGLPPPPTASRKPLPFSLVGTVAAGPFGMAFLKVQGRPNELVLGVDGDLGEHLGAEWAGYRLIEVARKSATFRRGADTRKLEMKSGVQLKPTATPSTPTPPPATSPQPSPAPAAVETETRPVERSEVERVAKNLAFMVTQLSVQPFFRKGRPSGVRVARIRPGSFFARMGVQNGDVVQGVNGQKVAGLRDSVKLHKAFQDGGDVTVEILRAGATRRITYQIR